MHNRIRQLLEYLDGTIAEVRTAVDSVPAELHTERPAPDRWSVAEVVDHLSLVEQRIAAQAAKQIEAGRVAGLGPDANTTNVLESFDAARVVDRRRRVVASENAQPRHGVDLPTAWSALTRAREAVQAAVLSGDGLNLSELVVPHSVLGHMNLYHWIAFIGAHELRHAEQIREVGADLSRGPQAETAPARPSE